MRTRFRGDALWAAFAVAVCAATIVLPIVLPIVFQGLAAQNSARDALWLIVHNQCVPDEVQNRDPKPCAEVDLSGGENRGFALLKDVRGTSQYLLIPTARISGIESPELLAPNPPDYFEDAWEARSYVNEALHRTLPREDISLAVNSKASRSQDQLHIHVDCVRADVRAAVRDHAAQGDPHWMPFPVAFFGHHYQAIWEPGEDLKGSDPFQLLAAGLPGAAADMRDRTLVVVGAKLADGKPGFVILEDGVNRPSGDRASGEELQDHSCRVAADAGAGHN